MNLFKDLTNLYPVSKTLRFELIPVNETLANIHNSKILEEDQNRAESYLKVKKIIDKYHKYFIDLALDKVCDSEIGEEITQKIHLFSDLYRKSKKSPQEEKEFENLQTQLRKLIVKALAKGIDPNNDPKGDTYKHLFGKELIEDILPLFTENREEQALLSEFKGFTSYFVGFHENRKNIYSEEAQSTAIGYRLIHDNLPKFIDNLLIFQKIKEPLCKELESIYNSFAQEGYMNVKSLEELFSLDYYTQVLSAKGIELYNAVIGKIVKKDKTELKGFNEHINLYNQQRSREERLPSFKPLHKQILSDREQLSWLPEAFNNDRELIVAIEEYYQHINNDILERIRLLMSSINEYDLNRIYLKNNTQLTNISKKIFGDWSTINLARERFYDSSVAPKKQNAKYEEKRSQALEREKSLSIAHLQTCIAALNPEKEHCIEKYFAELGPQKENIGGSPTTLIEAITLSYQEAQQLLTTEVTTENELIQNKEKVALIKDLLDRTMALLHFVKPLLGGLQEAAKDEKFYGELDYIWNSLDLLTPLYNKVRNYLTRKPYSTQKIKLNFGNSTLLNGWDRNKEKDNSAIILRKEGNYYLAIMHKKHNKSFEREQLPCSGPCYEKMDYKLLPGPNKMLPKVFLSQKGVQTFKPSATLQANYAQGTHKKGDNFNLADLHNLIDYFKKSIEAHEDWSKFEFKFSDTSSYEDISAFYKEVESQGYKLSFRNISEEYIHSLVKEGKLYLFQIYNKDFSPKSKGAPNLHTLYWKMLFDERNLANVVYKLNGQAELFFRKRSLKNDRPTHPANIEIDKKILSGKSLFGYDLIKDRRYTVDKFQFHVPITMNFKSTQGDRVNSMVHKLVKDNKDLCVIGIDRGERHLLYLCVIDGKGRIILQQSLNKIVSNIPGNNSNNFTFETDYHALLEKRDTLRQEERKNWQTIEGIKELKQGYLSQVVHQITQLMVKYNAIVALEDLNMGFKQGRQKVESSVYQQFEKQLIDKLNYLVFKNIDTYKEGGILKAYQFTAPFKSFRDMGKQNGLLFYVPAWNTSKIDPLTGFVCLFNIRYESVEKSKTFLSKFKSIRYNPQKEWFEFDFDYRDFTSKAEGSRTQWTLCTHSERIGAFRNPKKNNQWDYEKVYLSPELCKLFQEYGIDFTEGKDLKISIENQTEKDFFVRLLKLIGLTLQMRNSRKDTGEDYIVSPVADANGEFFDSRNNREVLPKDADANGAYHIALKGLWALRQMRDTPEGEKVKLAISNKEWLSFVQEKPYTND